MKTDNIMLSNQKNESLQALRCLAFITIFVSHLGHIDGFLGAWGVSVFVVLSGFLMSYRHFDDDISININDRIRFTKIRLSILYPLHIIMMFLALALNIVVTSSSFSVSYLKTLSFKIILDCLLVQSYIPIREYYEAINGVSWYLSVSVITMFVFPIFINCVKKWDSKHWSILFLLSLTFVVEVAFALGINTICDFLVLGGDVIKWGTYRFPIFRVCDFCFGCIVGLMYKRQSIKKEFSSFFCTIIEIVIILINISVIYVGFKHGDVASWYDRTVIFTIPTSILVVCFACNRGKLVHLLTNKVTVFLGNISGYLFLIHQVVIQYCKKVSVKSDAVF